MSSEPPVTRYKLTLEVTGNTLEELRRELAVQANDAQHGLLAGLSIGGRYRMFLEEQEPGMTPEKYKAQLDAYMAEVRAARLGGDQ